MRVWQFSSVSALTIRYCGYAIFTSLWGGAAHAVTLAEYEAADQATQNRIVAAVLRAYYNHYASREDTEWKARCLTDLYAPAPDGSGKPLIRYVINDIDTAALDTTRSYTIEGIVENIVDRECSPK